MLTREVIEDIRDECFASDIVYSFEKLKYWNEDQVRDFFELGGDSLAQTATPLFLANGGLAERLQMMQAVAAGGSADASALSVEEASDAVSTFSALSADSKTAECRRFVITALLRSLSLAGDAGDAVVASLFGSLMSITCSSEPTYRIELGEVWGAVLRLPPAGPFAADVADEQMDGTVGVLLLGFGGSTLGSLEAYERVYAERWPTWLRLTHAGPLLLDEESAEGFYASADAEAGADVAEAGARALEHPATQAALDALMRGVRACERLVIHLVSNQGHMVWTHLLRREGRRLSPKVVAMVYDCAPARRDFFDGGSSDAALIHGKTVLAMLRGAGAKPPVGCGALIERGSRLVHNERARRGAGAEKAGLALADETFDWQVRRDPCVPTLCLTSEEDSVVAAAGVRRHADDLRAAHPTRDVRVVTLNGAHVALVHMDAARYAEAIGELLARCGFQPASHR